jgi:hypothetical protein
LNWNVWTTTHSQLEMWWVLLCLLSCKTGWVESGCELPGKIMSLFFPFPMNTYSHYCLVLQTEKNFTQIQIYTVCDRNMASMCQILITLATRLVYSGQEHFYTTFFHLTLQPWCTVLMQWTKDSLNPLLLFCGKIFSAESS